MGKLQKIIINNFRIHRNTIVFSGKKQIDNFLILVGANDTGKSSVLKALDLFFNEQTVTINDFRPNLDINIECKFENKSIKRIFKYGNTYSESFHHKNEIPKYTFFDINNQFDTSEIENNTIDDLILVVENQLLRYINYNVVGYINYNATIESYANDDNYPIAQLLNNWKVLLEDFNRTNKNILIKYRGMGVQRICALYYHIMQSIMRTNSKEFIFAIDEPELSLHPEQQRKLIQILLHVAKYFTNIQILIATHSPYIVNEANTKHIFVLKHKTTKDKEGNIIALPEIKANPLKDRVLKHYKSMAEINYLAFGEVSKDYHIELFGYIQNQLSFKYDNDNTFKNNWDCLKVKNKNGELKIQQMDPNGHSWLIDKVTAVDAWLVNANNVNYFKNNVNGNYKWYDTNQIDDSNYTGELRTLPYCVRNNIDHPLIKCSNKKAKKNNAQYDNIELIRQSIEIMRQAIIDNNL